jgi:TRAP-type C4-dicarboxylate transport system substrate-binding protein
VSGGRLEINVFPASVLRHSTAVRSRCRTGSVRSTRRPTSKA